MSQVAIVLPVVSACTTVSVMAFLRGELDAPIESEFVGDAAINPVDGVTEVAPLDAVTALDITPPDASEVAAAEDVAASEGVSEIAADIIPPEEVIALTVASPKEVTTPTDERCAAEIAAATAAAPAGISAAEIVAARAAALAHEPK